MIITSAVVTGYKPLKLGSIECISINFVNKITLVDGRNGCGKSSLLKILSPMPANKGDFRAGGSIVVNIKHKNSEYVCISDFTGSGKYQFIKDGDNLNCGGTKTVQTSLVERELGYSMLVHRLMIGEITLTSMTPSARKEIMTMISPEDLTYAMGMYKTLKEKARDTQGALKHTANRLTDVKAKLKALDIEENICGIQSKIESAIASLIPFSVKDVKPLNAINKSLDELMVLYNRAAERLQAAEIILVNDSRVQTFELLLSEMGSCEGQLLSLAEARNVAIVELEKLTEVTSRINDSNLTQDEISLIIKRLHDDINDLPKSYYVNTNQDDVIKKLQFLLHEMDNVYDDIIHKEIIGFFSDDKIKSVRTEYNMISSAIGTTNQKLATINAKITQTYELKSINSKNVKCPNCDTHFVFCEHSVVSELQRLDGIRDKSQVALEEQEQILNKLIPQMDNIIACEQVISRATNIRNDCKLPYEFWDEFSSIIDVLKNKNIFKAHILKWIRNTEQSIVYESMQNDLSQYNQALLSYSLCGGNAAERIMTLQLSINDNLSKRDEVEERLSHYTKVHKAFVKSKGLLDIAEEIRGKIDEAFKNLADSEVQATAKKHCDALYLKMSTIKQKIHHKEIHEASIEELEIDYDTLSKDYDAYMYALEKLSPNDGLIADHMLEFINEYIVQINEISSRIWGYSLELGICDIEECDLTYKFPLLVEGENVCEVSDGSTGQKEIIDLAFIIVMRRYLDLNEYPLYLDETGASFYEFHRVKLMDYIKDIVDFNLVSQIFMVNHYAGVTGCLSNHDVIILDDTEIVLPETYNDYVTITKF